MRILNTSNNTSNAEQEMWCNFPQYDRSNVEDECNQGLGRMKK